MHVETTLAPLAFTDVGTTVNAHRVSRKTGRLAETPKFDRHLAGPRNLENRMRNSRRRDVRLA